MKRIKSQILFALLVSAQMSLANVVTGVAAVPDHYYDGVDAKSSPEAILEALYNQIKDHTSLNYNSLESYYSKTDLYDDTIWDIYSTCKFDIDKANCSQDEVCDCWNKEHSIPQSWFHEGSPMKSDLFHVYPTDARVNGFRSNLPYGEVEGGNGTGFKDNKDGRGLGKKGSNTFPGYSGTVFEPADEFKGDLARTYFYMVARYRTTKFTQAEEGRVVFTDSKTNLTEFAKNLFLKWHRQDPVSEKEIDRNQAVYELQNNRNPFIDYPDLAEFIWGERVGQQVDLSAMVPTCDGGGATPIVTVNYGVTWSVSGEEMQVDSVAQNRKLKALPDGFVSCSTESSLFMGWTDAPLSGIQDEAPAVLYTRVTDFPAVKEDVTYYAVFAKAEQTGTFEPMIYVYDENNPDGWTNTAKWTNNSYWLLDKDKTLVSPTVDLSGLTSITVKMRTYGGEQYCNLDVKAGEMPITTLEATAGKTIKDYTWENNAPLSGLSPLTFSTNYAASQGIGFQSVTVNVTGGGMTYSRYITSCQTTAEMALPSAETDVHKRLVGGRMLIERNGHTYTITGTRIR